MRLFLAVFPPAALTVPGAPGVVAGVTGLDGADGGLPPSELVATTVKV